jgi:hypothetical protein
MSAKRGSELAPDWGVPVDRRLFGGCAKVRPEVLDREGLPRRSRIPKAGAASSFLLGQSGAGKLMRRSRVAYPLYGAWQVPCSLRLGASGPARLRQARRRERRSASAAA